MEPRDIIAGRRWPVWLNATILLLVSWLAIAVMSLQTRPGADVVAVVFPPWWNAGQAFGAVASANAAVVRITALSSLLVVRPNEHDGLARLRQAGAWFTMDPRALAACLSTSD